MKFATYKDNTRDGILLVVSKDLQKAVRVEKVAASYNVTGLRNLQQALDDWEAQSPKLSRIYDDLNKGTLAGEAFDQSLCHSPLPRAYEWIDGSAFINHIVLVRKARGAEPPETLETDPLVYQGGSGVFLGPKDDIPLGDSSWGLDFESEVCVILGDTPQGTKSADAEKYIRLVTIANDVSLRGLIPSELAKQFGFFQSKPATAFAPVAVTPDEIGSDFRQGRLHLDLHTHLNGKLFGKPNAGKEMHFSFAQLIEHICKTRSFTAGTILGSGTISNEDESVGSSCLQEQRMLEKIKDGEFKTPFLKDGDKVEIEMFDKQGHSIFGKIEQKVKKI